MRATPAESTAMITPLRVRRSLEDLQDEYASGNKKPLEDLIRAWKGIQELPPSDPRSFFVLGRYHGEPFRRRRVGIGRLGRILQPRQRPLSDLAPRLPLSVRGRRCAVSRAARRSLCRSGTRPARAHSPTGSQRRPLGFRVERGSHRGTNDETRRVGWSRSVRWAATCSGGLKSHWW
jgi:hypothetical protein